MQIYNTGVFSVQGNSTGFVKDVFHRIADSEVTAGNIYVVLGKGL